MHGKLVVQTPKGEHTYRFGGRPHLDWRTAPLGEVFLRHDVGEAYELDTGATADGWLVERARRAFAGLPKRPSESASAQVIALKRNPAVRAELDAFIGWKQPKSDDKLPRSRARLLHLFGDKERLARIAAAGG